MDSELEHRVRANCSEIHGLTTIQFEQHIAGIVRMIERARAGQRLPKPRAKRAA
jgi:hypothetical protein